MHHEVQERAGHMDGTTGTDEAVLWFHRGRTTYTQHNDVTNAASLLDARIAHLEKGGYTILDHELHIDPAADPKVQSWILFTR
jgi:hypothetical protein